MAEYDYDLFVIGAGSGGVRAARMAAQYGAKVAIAEEYRVGGTCVIRGCVPKKLFVYASRFGEAFEDAEGFGWSASKPDFDWPTLITNKDREIDRLNGIYTRNLERSGVRTYMSRAVLEDTHSIHLPQLDETVRAKYVLIATGSRPFVPEFPGREHVITSDEAFQLEQLPGNIAIIGGGYIAVEFVTIFSGLGVPVTLIYRGPQVLRGFDGDLRDGLTTALAKRGVDVPLKRTHDGDVARLPLRRNQAGRGHLGHLRVIRLNLRQPAHVTARPIGIMRDDDQLLLGTGVENPTLGKDVDRNGDRIRVLAIRHPLADPAVQHTVRGRVDLDPRATPVRYLGRCLGQQQTALRGRRKQTPTTAFLR